MDISNLTQTLADVQVTTIVWFAVIATVIRLGLIRYQSSGIRIFVEFVEAMLIAGVLVYMVMEPLVVKAFYIPSGSMLPTLIEDDHIIVNKFQYRYSPPHHDDIVVFPAPPQALALSDEASAPGEQVDYIKRLIGLPGDVIQVVGGYVEIGDHRYSHIDVRKALGIGLDADSIDHDHIKFVPDGVMVYFAGQWTKYSPIDIEEKMMGISDLPVSVSPGYVVRNHVKVSEPFIAEDPDYDMQLTPQGDVVLTTPDEGMTVDGSIPMPSVAAQVQAEAPAPLLPGKVIVMGDNRNDSNDSTRWGPLDESRLAGRAVFIFFPFDRIRILH